MLGLAAEARALNRGTSAQVDYYGAPTPLRQIASLSAPEAGMLVVQPYDKSAIPNIEKAIMTSDLGLTPGNDGNLIRINVPQLTAVRLWWMPTGLVSAAHVRCQHAWGVGNRIGGRRWPSWCPSWGRRARLPSGTAATLARSTCSRCMLAHTRACLPRRNVRRDAIKVVDKMKGDVSEDEQKSLSAAIQDLTDDYVKQIEGMVKSKQDELTTV